MLMILYREPSTTGVLAPSRQAGRNTRKVQHTAYSAASRRCYREAVIGPGWFVLRMAPAWVWIGLAVVTALVYGLRPRWIWRVRHIPGPWPYWLTGNMLSILAMGSHLYHAQLKKKYGPIFKTYGLGRPYVVLTSAKLIREALLHSQVRFDLKGLDIINPEFEDAGILFSKGEHWKLLRGFWAPMFFTGSLERYAGLMNRAAGRLVQRLDRAASSGEVVNLWRHLGDLTLDVVGMSAFGVELNMQLPLETLEPEDAERVKQLRSAAAIFFTGFANNDSRWFILTVLFPEIAPAVRWLARKFPDRAMVAFRQAVQYMIDYTCGLVKQHRASLQGNPDSQAQQPNGHVTGGQNGRKEGHPSLAHDPSAKAKSTAHLRKGVEPGSFLDLLVRQVDSDPSKHLSDLAIAQQVHSVLLAGYETTANTLAFAVHQLALHPDKAARLRAEADSQPREPDYEALQSMAYADAVVRETLRLFPTGAVAIREATRDMVLGGYKIPAGQAMIASFWSLHRDESLWENAEAFMPERWLDHSPKAVERRQNAWKAFGDGARGCPGWRFAVEEAKIALYHLSKNFEFELAPNQDPLPMANNLTLAPKHGVFVQVQRRG